MGGLDAQRTVLAQRQAMGWDPPQLQHTCLQKAQCYRALLLPPQGFRACRDSLRQTCQKLPGCRPPSRHRRLLDQLSPNPKTRCRRCGPVSGPRRSRRDCAAQRSGNALQTMIYRTIGEFAEPSYLCGYWTKCALIELFATRSNARLRNSFVAAPRSAKAPYNRFVR